MESALHAYRAAIESHWIDYNGHLRDAYYAVIMSSAIDDVMDQLDLDAAYRERSRCTLYTLEMHLHYLHEVKSTDELTVQSVVLDADRKRIHMGFRFACPRVDVPVATGDAMLLHVHQGEKPASAAFPAEIEQRLRSLKLEATAAAAWGPVSRKIEIIRR